MLNADGKYTQLTLNDARTLVLQAAAAAGVDVPAGSVEDQIKEFLAQIMVQVDAAQYASIVKQFNPTGSDIDLQNPGFPRLAAASAKGFLQIVNGGGESLSFPEGTVFTAPNGNTYTNVTSAVTVGVGETGYLSIQSVETGADQKLPADQAFTGGPGGTITNPQPLTGGRDIESDSAYLNRLTFYKSNNVSIQSTVAAKKELLETYDAVELYVNSDNDGITVPIPIPPQGLNCVILLASGIHAGPEEIAAAIGVLTRRFEFGNLNSQDSDLHPIIQGSSYTGVYPQAYSLTPAQAVAATVDCQVNVSFPPDTLSEEKQKLAEAFATAFVQRLIRLLSGSEGTFTFVFEPLAADPVTSTPPVSASENGPVIAPFIAIEAVRSLIAGQNNTGDNTGVQILTCENLSIELDPNEYEQNPILLSIHAPYEGTLATVNFKLDALFSDGTSWYDRFVTLDPSRITVTLTEAVA